MDMYKLELNMMLASPLDCALAQLSHCQSYVQRVKKRKVLVCHPVGVVRMPAFTETLTCVHSSVFLCFLISTSLMRIGAFYPKLLCCKQVFYFSLAYLFLIFAFKSLIATGSVVYLAYKDTV